MANVTQTTYGAFASFTLAATTYYLGTRTELRGGNWYTGAGPGVSGLRAFPEPQAAFADDGVVQGNPLTLEIADNAGTFRTLVQGNAVDGMAVAVDLVTGFTYDDGTSSELVSSVVLTVRGKRLVRGGIALDLVDVEDERLGALYPPSTYSTTDWPELTADDAGKPICEPVGTALKLPCALVRADTAASWWWYAACTATPKLYPITGVSSLAKQITVTGDLTGLVEVGQVLYVTGSTAADGRYTVAAMAYGGSSVITVVEVLPASTGGTVVAMPLPLAVYRGGRLVPTTEYLVEQSYVPCTVVNGDFSLGATGWLTNNTGTGTVTFAGGVATLNSPGGGSRGRIFQYFNASGSGSTTKNQYFALYVKLGAGTDASILNFNESPVRVTANAATCFLLSAATTNPGNAIQIAVWNDLGTTVVDEVRVIALPLVLLRFTREQRDFNGALYPIQADMRGVESRNVADEIKRLLTAAGATADAASFAAGQGVATAASMLVDCDYGRTEQRRVRAILEDLLFIARGTLERSSAGAYRLVQDVTAVSAGSWDESAGDRVRAEGVEYAPRPSSVALRYRPSSADPAQLQHTITRNVVGGVGAPDTPRELRYLRDHTAADSLLCYLALRAQYNGQLSATAYSAQQSLGQRLAFTAPSVFDGVFDGLVWQVQRVPNGNALVLREYNAAVYTYTAAPLPTDAQTAYQPDYSNTPPSAPTALKITAGSTAIANDGTVTARVTVECVPPSVNWAEVWFAVIHNTTAELVMVRGDAIGGGKYGATIPGLRPGEVYQLNGYVKNAFALRGTLQQTFDATALGGGAAVTTFTAPGQATLPPNVASCTATQAMGRIANVTWPAVSATNLWGYVLERRIGAGAYAEVWRGQATVYGDNAVAIGTAYQYRVKARDTYGNVSAAYATSGSVTPAGNIVGGTVGNDIASTTVATANRTNVTTISATVNVAVAISASGSSVALSHSLGRQPVACVQGGVMAVNATSTTSNVTITYFSIPTDTANSNAANTGSSNATNPHTHTITHDHALQNFFSTSAPTIVNRTVYVDVW